MTRDVGFANPQAFCIFTIRRGEHSLLETVSRLFAVPDIQWKIVRLASFIFIDVSYFLPLRLLFITQLLNYEAKRVINYNKTAADQGSAYPPCSITAHQEQILPTRIASQKLKIYNGRYPLGIEWI